ncbi:MAG: glycine zipper 2TM domain-containing protein [Proteobacteria bacterium]|nr:glycine zipper 2TM domain-containing protein [Pseudomonadota bacterium]
MRKTLSLLAAAATVVAPAAATVALPGVAAAQAAPYLSNPCGPTQRNHRIVGGGVGAVAGYFLGGRIAADNTKQEGKALGALAGAAAGQEIGRRTGCQAAYRQAQHRAYAYQPGYSRPACKAIAGGRSVCLQPDGRWR